MGGCRCSYKTCANFTRPGETLHFFHYPVKNKPRCDNWIKNACKPQFHNLTLQQLRNKVICEQHFEDHCFPNSAKKRLLRAAVPTLDGPNIVPNKETLASALDNFKVVPANEDGTIFVLDTVNMSNSLNSSKSVESYVYKDGSLLPLKQEMEWQNTQSDIFQEDPMALDNDLVDNDKADNYNLNLRSVPQPNNTQQNKKNNFFIEMNSNDVADECSLIVENNELPRVVKSPIIISKQIIKDKRVEKLPEKTVLRIIEQPTKQQSASNIHSIVQKSYKPATELSSHKPARELIDSKYINKIKQHSKEIATIKRMLRKTTHNRPLPDKKILNTLKCRLPASLYTILNLALCNTYNFSSEDIQFFTSIHEKSPDVYTMLSEKYKWNFPPMEELNKILNKQSE